MKGIDNIELETTAQLIRDNSRDCDLDFRLESYSLKWVTSDKRQWKVVQQHEQGTEKLQPLSPPDRSWTARGLEPPPPPRLRHVSERSGSGSDGDTNELVEAPVVLLDTIVPKTLFSLTRVLNCSFPDYNFDSALSSHFSLVPNVACVVSDVSIKLSSSVGNFADKWSDSLWAAADRDIRFDGCRIYSYVGDEDSPFTEDGVIWHFNYLIYNPELRRILFLACRALARRSQSFDENEEMWTCDE